MALDGASEAFPNGGALHLPFLTRAPKPMVWLLLGCWLVYSFGTLAWYLLNDPAFMASICKVT